MQRDLILAFGTCVVRFSREQAKSDCDWSVFVASQSSCFFLCWRVPRREKPKNTLWCLHISAGVLLEEHGGRREGSIDLYK
jgi:hypothetical protein